ncbi:MAG: methionine--tRNA ligase [Acholeplasmatales bacterium]|nr:methionine--tRNA ligase [Acholeplasmatales bacterium]
MDKKKFYLSTAIAYTSSTPHIGNVYEAILADAICRMKRTLGYDVYFQTGTDEHGQKIERKALSQGVTPKEHVDHVSGELKKIYDLMNVSYDRFIRTTDEDHMDAVQKIFERLLKKGDIYKGYYEGYYCVADEAYYTEKDLVNGCCPDCGKKVELTREESYFLRLKPYQERLVNHIKSNPEFIQPESRKNEMLNNFLKDDLPDLCVSRTSFKWGIPVTSDPKHVIYVWIDALCNYITGIGYNPSVSLEEQGEMFKKFWPADVHLIGKDILRFHTIYWPIILMALDLPLPRQVFGHPWVLFGNDKMSKSKGNVIYAQDLVKRFGVDPVRYYVLHEIPFAQDGSITYELLMERYNSDLANTLGNLVSRSLAMTNKYFNGTVKYHGAVTEFDKDLEESAKQARINLVRHMDEFKTGDALEDVMKFLRRANKYVDETAPWVLAKDPSRADELENALYHLLESIKEGALMLEPFMPETSQKIYKFLNLENPSFNDLEKGYSYVNSYTIGEYENLFQRLDTAKVLEEIKTEEARAQEEAKKSNEQADALANHSKPLITIDDFDKVELAVGKILEARKHPKADKLLVFKVDLGTEVRQIVSGIAKFYEPEKLIGKKVVVVKNLAPIKLRGEESCGMLLCASNQDDTQLELLDGGSLNPGDNIR